MVAASVRKLMSPSRFQHAVRKKGAFLYNVALLLLSAEAIETIALGAYDSGDDILSNLHISILCATLEDVAFEADATTRLRRLMVAGRILQPISTRQTSGDESNVGDGLTSKEGRTNVMAKQLARDLGFPDALRDIVHSTSTTDDGNTTKDDRTLAAELLLILDS